MDDVSFDALTRKAGSGISRRASFGTLGAAGLMAFAGRFAADAKKKKARKNGTRKNDADRKARQKCKQQVGQCISFLTDRCENDPVCLALSRQCCPIAGSCDVVEFFTCLGI